MAQPTNECDGDDDDEIQTLSTEESPKITHKKRKKKNPKKQTTKRNEFINLRTLKTHKNTKKKNPNTHPFFFASTNGYFWQNGK